MRKRILHFIKTNHFKLRQKERLLSEKQIKDVIIHGDMTEREGSIVFTYKNLEVVTNFDDDLLITIIKKPEPPKMPKIISDEEALKIKNVITSGPKIKTKVTPPPKRSKEDDLTIHKGEVEISLEDYLNQTKK